MELTREQILTKATEIHDETGCRCDRKYLYSCVRLAQAILEVGKSVNPVDVE